MTLNQRYVLAGGRPYAVVTDQGSGKISDN
jgi:hypothetical protein